MHEHVTLALSGSVSDTLIPGPARSEVLARSLDWMAKLKDRGIDAIVDPAPADLGRNLELAAELSARTGLQIVCATGLFTEHEGGSAYWSVKKRMMGGDPRDYHRYMADVFINEIINGVGPARLKCGIIKVASHQHITDYEDDVLQSAAIASIETTCPITTHSGDGYLGRQQQSRLVSLGVPAHHIIVGHS